MAGEEIAGLCLCDVNEEHIARIGRKEGWVDILGVRRPYRRQGLGRALLLAGLHVLKEAEMESAMLGVDADSLTGVPPACTRAWASWSVSGSFSIGGLCNSGQILRCHGGPKAKPP